MNKQKKKQKNNGITLIALVLTIIVLLILAAVALSLALGQNGLIFKARQSKQDQQIALEKDRIMTAYGASFTNKDGKFNKVTFKGELENQGVKLDGEIEGNENATPLNLKVTTKLNGYTVTYTIEDGRIINNQIGQNNLVESGIQVGDTIIYDPTKGVTDNSKLTYTSQKGTAQAGGNGYGTQTVTIDQTAKEWIVISTHNNQIKVMAKEPVKGVTGAEYENQFTLKGGIGWLYAEEELHKACSIYGHGKGVAKQNIDYYIGNTFSNGKQRRTLTDTAARSMRIEEIVNVLKGSQYNEFTLEDKKRLSKGDYENPSKRIEMAQYPATYSVQEDASGPITSCDYRSYNIFYNSGGNAGSAGAWDYVDDFVNSEEVKKIKRKLGKYIYHNTPYWLANQAIETRKGDPDIADFEIYFNYKNGTESIDVYQSVGSGFTDVSIESQSYYLRPVVYLNPTMLEKISEGQWKIKD
ncbi:MAG: hypothetical protein ACTTGJ_04255 [Clostridium sp.]